MNKIRSICVYCGSHPGTDPDHMAAARTLGDAIGAASLELVYGGGNNGLMGAVAFSTLDAGGKVTGIIPEFLVNRESLAEDLARLTKVQITKNMHERKHAMFEQSDAFVALPGGIGTLEEIVEIMTWAQLGRHDKPILFANINGFWDPMLNLLKHMDDLGFIHTNHLLKPLVESDPANIVPTLLATR